MNFKGISRDMNNIFHTSKCIIMNTQDNTHIKNKFRFKKY